MPSDHSNVMGGSTAHKRMNCTASYKLEAAMPHEESSEFAERGSMLHAGMELIITADPVDMAEAEPLFNELEGQDMGFTGHEITRELIDTKLRPATQAWFDFVEKFDVNDWFIEQKVSLEGVIDGAFGTADILAKDSQDRLHVLDWKFGDGVPVPVKQNYGASFYAAAALYDNDPEMMDFTEVVDGVVLHIVQPRTGSTENPWQYWETDEEYIEKFLDRAIRAIEQARSVDATAKPGDWCRWCKAKPICPEYDKLAADALSKSPEAMSGVELAEAMRTAQLLKSWIDDVFKLAQHELEQGAAIPGFKLVNKQSRRVWIDPAEAEKRLRKVRAIKVADMYKQTLISPAQFEKKFPKVYSKLHSDLIKSHVSGYTIVDDSDKRPAVTGQMPLLANALEKANSKQETGK